MGGNPSVDGFEMSYHMLVALFACCVALSRFVCMTKGQVQHSSYMFAWVE
jgi:hypothetical protein